MAKAAPTGTLDAFLDKIATANIMTLCSAEPTTRTEAVTTYALADVAMAGGDFTKAAGSPDGRQTTVGSKSGVAVDASGTATHVALSDASNLIYVTTCTSQAVTSGNTASISSWVVTIRAPT